MGAIYHQDQQGQNPADRRGALTRQQQQGRRLPHAVSVGPTMPSTQPLLLGLAVAAGAAAAVVASGALPAPSAAQLKMLRAGGRVVAVHALLGRPLHLDRAQLRR